MSDELTKYVLRPELEVQPTKDSVGHVTHYSFNAPVQGTCATLNKHIFNNIFQPVSDLSRENQPETKLCHMCGEEIDKHQTALTIPGIGVRHNYDCDLLMDSPVSIASENLKQQIAEILHWAYLSGEEHQYSGQAPDKGYFTNEAERILELIQRSKE